MAVGAPQHDACQIPSTNQNFRRSLPLRHRAPNVSRADSVGVPQRMSRGLPECSAAACPTPSRTLSPTMPNASRPASMRLAMAISPSRDRSSTEPISRRYMRTGSSARADSSELLPLAGAGRFSSTISPPSFCISGSVDSSLPLRCLRSSGSITSVSSARTPSICSELTSSESICSELTSSEGNTELIWSLGDVAALLGGADELLDGRIRQVEGRAVGRGLGTLVLRHLFLLWRRIGLGCHESLPSRRSARSTKVAHAPWHPRQTQRHFKCYCACRRHQRCHLYETETSVRRRFLGSSRKNHCLPVFRYVGCRTYRTMAG